METPGYGKSMWEHILTSRAVSDSETERRFLVFLSFFGGGERWMCICWGWRWMCICWGLDVDEYMLGLRGGCVYAGGER